MAKRYGMLVDLDKCIGCRACELACKQENNVKPRVGEQCDFEQTGVPFWKRVYTVGPFGEYPNLTMYFYPSLCMHCDDPPCMHVCPNDAIYQRPDGIVLIEKEKCDGARKCFDACPYPGVLWHDFEEGWTEKCTFCFHRLDEGKEPACVFHCPAEALYFGDIEDPNSQIFQRLEANRKYLLGIPTPPHLQATPAVFHVLRKRQAGHVGVVD